MIIEYALSKDFGRRYLLCAIDSESWKAQLGLEEVEAVFEAGDWNFRSLVEDWREWRRTYSACQYKIDIHRPQIRYQPGHASYYWHGSRYGDVRDPDCRNFHEINKTNIDREILTNLVGHGSRTRNFERRSEGWGPIVLLLDSGLGNRVGRGRGIFGGHNSVVHGKALKE